MRLIKLLLVMLLLVTHITAAQTRPKVLIPAEYARQIKLHPEKKLVEIKKAIPGIKLDIKYATTDNFMHRVMYSQARAFARAPVVEALKQIQADLKPKGLGLKIFDAYRPYAITVKFYEMVHDTSFVASPQKGSRHNRGCAIDLSLINLKTGKELTMPTPFDSFSVKAAADYTGISPAQLKNREMLKAIMQAHNFTVLKTEWWHFDFNGWQQYELLDVPFSNL